MVRIFFCALLYLLSAMTHAAVIATLDRTTIALNETVTLRYESSVEETRIPDFSPINKDFDIVGQNRQTSVNIINGAMQRKTIFELVLAPKRVGILEIPEVSFTQAVSASISVSVKQNVSRNNSKDFNFTVTADKTRARLQEQIILTVKLERAVNTTQENFSDLTFSHQDFIIEPLTNRFNRYEAIINGRRYVVYEKQFALFPQKTGSLLVNPMSYTAVVPDNTQPRRGFFDDPFGRATGKTIRERTATLRLDIIDKPVAADNYPWLPAKSVKIDSELLTNNDALRVGDSITHMMTLTAEQQLATALPDITIQQPLNAQIYPDQTQSQQTMSAIGVTSQKVFRAAIVLTQAGDVVLPAQNLYWYNTESQTVETILIPEKRLSVLPALSSNNANSNIATSSQGLPSNSAADALPISKQSSSSLWFYLALFTSLGWLLTLLYLFFAKFFQARGRSTDFITSSVNIHTVIKTAQTGDASKTKTVLLAWGQSVFSQSHITTLDDLCGVIDEAELSENIRQLQASLYNKECQRWDHNTFIRLFNQYKPHVNTVRKNEHLLFKIK